MKKRLDETWLDEIWLDDLQRPWPWLANAFSIPRQLDLKLLHLYILHFINKATICISSFIYTSLAKQLWNYFIYLYTIFLCEYMIINNFEDIHISTYMKFVSSNLISWTCHHYVCKSCPILPFCCLLVKEINNWFS